MCEPFERANAPFDPIIKARFGTTVCACVKAGLGIAIIDEFTVAHRAMPGITIVPIAEDTPFQTYVAVSNDRALSRDADIVTVLLRAKMRAVVETGKS
jgi:DNA-binding transcriptional LysR family regulator